MKFVGDITSRRSFVSVCFCYSDLGRGEFISIKHTNERRINGCCERGLIKTPRLADRVQRCRVYVSCGTTMHRGGSKFNLYE